MFKLAVIGTFVMLLLLSCNCEASILKSEDVTTVVPEVIETTEITSSEVPSVSNLAEAPSITIDSAEPPISAENATSDETQPIEVQNGSYFLLMMTILQDWSDEFMNKESDAFLHLAKNLGGELIDLIDNSQESKDINVTDFKLVEVQPSKNSLSSIYVTFVVSSRRELKGDELSGALSNQILLYGAVYEHKASIEGFMFKNISQEEAERDFGVQIICESAEKQAPHDTSSATNSTVVKDMHEIDTPQVQSDFEEEQTCKSEKIQRGSTSIYVFEDQQCVNGIRNKFIKHNDEDFDGTQMLNDQPGDSDHHVQQTCGKNVKRSTIEDDEVVVVIRKKGGKVFVEL